MSITDIGADAAQNSGSGSDGDSDYDDEYERFTLNGVSFGKQHPTTAVRGTAVALRKLYDENDPDRSDVAVILDDPSIVTSEAALDGSVVVLSEEEGDQFKVVNLDDDGTKKPSDSMIDFAGNTFYGDVGDDFGSHDRIALKRGGGAGTRIASTLDVSGATGAEAEIERDDDGELVDITLADDGFPQHNGGYIEYHPEGRDGERPRQSRDPELRPDVVGNEVVIMIQRLSEVDPDYDGPAYWATVFANLDDDRMDELAEQYAADDDGASPDDFMTELDGDTFIRLDTTDEFEPSDDLLDSTGWIEWNTINDSDPVEVQMLNETRVENGFDGIWVPDGLSVEDVAPDGVEVESSPTEDDMSDDDVITPFGQGAPEPVEADA